MHPIQNYLLILLLFLFNIVIGQNYHGINGSSFAGSLGISQNPASIVNTPYVWDITPIAIQEKHTTNAFTIKNYSLLSRLKKADVSIQNGTKKRFLLANQDIRLLNTRISLNSKAAIAFGVNIRNYIYSGNGTSNWQDSISTLADFMQINIDHLPLSADFVASTWAELYATYARTIIDDGKRLLNAGATLKLNRSLAGGYASAEKVNYAKVTTIDGSYSLTDGLLKYGYSSNFDNVDNNNTAAANRKAFLQNTYSGISVDVGIEYILLADEDPEDNDDNTYDAKIGISVMDIGNNKYRHGRRSRLATADPEGVTDLLLENKFTTVSTFDNFNDSLASLSNSISTPEGDFIIYQPTRLVVNIDKHLRQGFFINAELTAPIFSLASKKTLVVRDMNLLALTPRWETKSLGVYLPFLFNSKKQAWIGAAFKAGPLLFGIHNLGSLFLKNKAQAGGFYLAFTIRPGKKYNRKAHNPRDRLTRKVKRSLECPTF